MRTIFSVIFLVAGFCLALPSFVCAETPQPSVTILTILDVPNGRAITLPRGINDHGDIVGDYSPPRNTFGFERFANGKFKMIIEPPRTYTVASGINNVGIICGYTGGLEGFFYDGTTFTLYDAPNSTTTIVEKENDAGDFVGTANIDGADIGFANIGGQFISFTIPGATLVDPKAINNRDEIVGRYYDAAGVHGFYRDPAGNLTYPITVQNSTFVNLNGINDKGEIAGDWADPAIDGYCHGFIMRLPNHVVTFDVPGSYNTSACDINNSGEITGDYYDFVAHGIHGFIGQLNR